MPEEDKGGVPPKATPGAPRPITVKLKPVASKTDTQKTAEAEAKKRSQSIPKETVVKAPSGPTARVPIPALDDIDDKSKAETAAPSTVKLRPVKVPGAKPPITPAAIKPAGAKPITQAVPVKDSHKPGSNPLPPGPKPPSDAQVQAAKKKTARIPLDTAIGVAPEGPMSGGAPKTIRLKRPAKLAGTGKMPTPATGPIDAPKSKARTAPIGKTSRIPDEAIEDTGDAATVTQKKTLKIKKKGAAASAAGGESADGTTDFEGLTPISDLNLTPVKGESPVFTAIAGVAAIAAVIVGILLVVCLASHAVGPGAGPNNLASVKAGMSKMWPGAIN